MGDVAASVRAADERAQGEIESAQGDIERAKVDFEGAQREFRESEGRVKEGRARVVALESTVKTLQDEAEAIRTEVKNIFDRSMVLIGIRKWLIEWVADAQENRTPDPPVTEKNSRMLFQGWQHETLVYRHQ